ncbi:hypothetical protein QBC43DRAFT_173354, partial [Cladorrhinum sp. PSN259]
PIANSSASQELEMIFRKAIQLQVDFARQTPWWYCEYPDSGTQRRRDGMQFNSNTMAIPRNHTSSSKARAKTVTLMISPALIKRGDPRGRSTQPIKVISKSQVVCGNLPR